MTSFPSGLVRQPALPALRILIVEDNPILQLGLEQSLKDYPEFRIVDQPIDGFLGVESALKPRPDWIAMDISLSGP